MKSRLLLLAVLLVIICASCQPKKKTEPEKEAVTGATYTNPLRERGAEPWAVFYKGKYKKQPMALLLFHVADLYKSLLLRLPFPALFSSWVDRMHK